MVKFYKVVIGMKLLLYIVAMLMKQQKNWKLEAYLTCSRHLVNKWDAIYTVTPSFNLIFFPQHLFSFASLHCREPGIG